MNLTAETNLYNQLFTLSFLLRFGYYDAITKSSNNVASAYARADGILPDIFNMNDFASYLELHVEFDEKFKYEFKNKFFSRKSCENCVRTEPISFTIPKTDISRREYKMPNVYSYLELAYYLSSKSSCFVKIFTENNHSTSKYFGQLNFDFKTTNEIKQNQLAGDNKLLHVDLSNFYPSLYTHTLPWIVNGRNNAKIETSGGFANCVDSLIQNCQFGETHGIPTGNLITRIIAELYMCFFDKRLEDKIGSKIRFSRYVDDFSYAFTSDEQRDKFLRSFRFVCREYCLIINEHKTEVTTFPFSHKMDKDTIFNYFNEKSLTNKGKPKYWINDISSFIDLCVKEENSGNKGSIKSCFPVIINTLHKLQMQKVLTKSDVNYIFSFKNKLTSFNVFKKLISLSLHDSKLTNRFISFTKSIIKLGFSKLQVKKLVKEYFTDNKEVLADKVVFYKENRYNQEVYQILLYLVFFGFYDFFEEKELLAFINGEYDDYTICLSIILYLKKFKFQTNNLINCIYNVFLETNSYYNVNHYDVNKKTPIMAEKFWLFRYFVYDLIKNNYISEKCVNNFCRKKNPNIKNFKRGGLKTLLNYKYALIANKQSEINNFYKLLLEKDIHFVSFGKNNNFDYL
ncbi:AbiK [Liquorilactobacillus oeni DSM 19972]|uniref:AbiK n=1 Tax=Liquorilactobacillus oeni DSM 19972 TaxID=1423777 RepID=A0A0R1M7T5_9LACO|nr:AbiK [Liquorilactobacillus oeni DSM 19972]